MTFDFDLILMVGTQVYDNNDDFRFWKFSTMVIIDVDGLYDDTFGLWSFKQNIVLKFEGFEQ